MISNLANLPYLGLPGTGTATLAGRTHVFTTEDFGSTGATGMTVFGNPAQPAPNTQPNPYAIINQAQSMLAGTLNQLTSGNIDSALGAVTTQKNQLLAKYNSGNASNEMKTVIQEQVKQLEDYERQLNILKSNSGQLDPQTAYQRSAYIKHGVENLINLSTTTIKAMEAQKAQETQQTSETQGDKPNTLEEKAQKVKEDNIYTRAGEEDLDKATVEAKYYDNIIDKLYESMKGWGTDDKALEEELNKINKDNVVGLMYYWSLKHPEESFMEMFMADADATQKKVYGTRIANAIEEAAKENGVDLTDDEDMKAIKNEMNSWLWINNSVADNYNNLVKKLLAKIDGVEYNFTEYSIFSK
jgi:hypothetical protein